MANEMDPDVTPRFCITARLGLLSWACCKIILDVIVFIYMVEPIVDIMDMIDIIDFLGWFITVLMAVLLFVDIVFQGKLIHGLRKNMVKHLTAYCKYTKLLWMYVLAFIAIYLLLLVTGFVWSLFRYNSMEYSVIINMSATCLGTLFQSFMMLLVIKEIKKIKGEDYQAISGKIKVFNIGFSIKIETSSTEKTNENESNTTNADETEPLEKKQLTV